MDAIAEPRRGVRRRALRSRISTRWSRARAPNQRYAPTYWVDTAGPPPEDDGPVRADIDADVVIIGSGFTGLATALFLAREHGIRATVLEANRVAWGCTSRNGGQGQNASGRLYRSQWIAKWGLETAQRLDREIRDGFETWQDLVSQVDCDAQDGGHLYIAHRPQQAASSSRANARSCARSSATTRACCRADELRERYVHDHEAVGALHEKEGVGIHPLKLAFGYLKMARAAGVKVHTGSPVTRLGDEPAVAPAAHAGRDRARAGGRASPPAATPRRACTRSCRAR